MAKQIESSEGSEEKFEHELELDEMARKRFMVKTRVSKVVFVYGLRFDENGKWIRR